MPKELNNRICKMVIIKRCNLQLILLKVVKNIYFFEKWYVNVYYTIIEYKHKLE